MADIERVDGLYQCGLHREAYRKRIYETADVRCARVPESNEGAALPVEMGKTAFAADFSVISGFITIYDRPRYELNTKQISVGNAATCSRR